MRKFQRCLEKSVVILSILLLLLLVNLFYFIHRPAPMPCRKGINVMRSLQDKVIDASNSGDMWCPSCSKSVQQTQGQHGECPYSKVQHYPEGKHSQRTNCSDLLKVSMNMTRLKSVIQCNQNTSSLTQNKALNSSPPFLIPFRDQCLSQFIKQHCYDGFRVPNVVHYVWFSKHKMDVYNMLSLLSVHRFLKPCAILLHSDVLPYGPYWQHVLQLVPNIIHVHRDAPGTIFGRRFGFVQHKADIARIEALKEYGGIYLDGDQLVLKSLDSFRNYNFVMGHENSKNLGNSFIISEKRAKFLDIWYKSYRSYNPKQWGIQSTFVPFTLAKLYPDLIHVENGSFIKPDLGFIEELYSGHYNWTDNFSIHLYTRWVQKFYTIPCLQVMNTSLGEIARWIMFGLSAVCTDTN